VYDSLVEEELVQLCRRGDNPAFAELMRRHQPAALKLAFSILRDRHDAEDEVQNAFWKAYEHIQQFQQHAKFSTWLTRIVVNHCLMRLRQAKRAQFHYIDEPLTADETVTLELRDPGPGPERQMGRLELAEILKNEIRRIPPLLGRVFLMREVEQRSIPEVAARLGISVSAAKSRLMRARVELRNRLQKHSGRLGAATLTA
jgi:RNA polymerase sigma-70 factor (ECF subfamily)